MWQAVLLQDTFLTVLLGLPPSATHTDVSVNDFAKISAEGNYDHSCNSNDVAYVRSSWMLANLAQRKICSPRCLDREVFSTVRQKSSLIADFRAVYSEFADPFRTWDATSLKNMARSNPRIVRQTLFLTSNYHHNLMLIHSEGLALGQDQAASTSATTVSKRTVSANEDAVADESNANDQSSSLVPPADAWVPRNGISENARTGSASKPPSQSPVSTPTGASPPGVPLNFKAVLDSAHDALQTFFVLYEIFPLDAAVWWVFNHRAFLEALCVGEVLRAVAADALALQRNALLSRAMADIGEFFLEGNAYWSFGGRVWSCHGH